MKINRCDTKAQATEKAREAMHTYIKKHKNRPVLLMLSGGSSLQLLDDFDESLLSSDITVMVLDERFTSEPELNNWIQITKTNFYKTAVDRGCEFLASIPEAGETLDEFADRLEDQLHAWIRRHPNRRVLATVGMGEDGHVAGISPFPEDPQKFVDFLFTSRWIVGYEGNLEPSERVTVTAAFIEKKIDFAVGYVVGDSKKDALARLTANDGKMADTPARILREMKGDCQVFTDQPA